MKKLLKRFWYLPFPPLKVDADADDDGRVGIWKAPLPHGTAELKTQWRHKVCHDVTKCVMTSKTRHNMKNLSWHPKVCYYIKNAFSLYFVPEIIKKNMSRWQKAGHGIKNTSCQQNVKDIPWKSDITSTNASGRQKVCHVVKRFHDVKSFVLTSICVCLFACWSLTSLCHSNGHIETMPAREINPFTALTRIRSQYLRTQWSTSNHQRVDTTTHQTAEPSGLATSICVTNVIAPKLLSHPTA